MHSRRGTEIIGVFEFGYTEDDELHRRAKQGHDGMMRLVSSVAPDSAVMPGSGGFWNAGSTAIAHWPGDDSSVFGEQRD